MGSENLLEIMITVIFQTSGRSQPQQQLYRLGPYKGKESRHLNSFKPHLVGKFLLEGPNQDKVELLEQEDKWEGVKLFHKMLDKERNQNLLPS